MQIKTLTTSKTLSYSFGQLGWWCLLNIINMQLVYFYLPPVVSGFPRLISEMKFFGIFSAIVFIAAGGRLIESITGPLMAGASDRSKFKMGRRIPFMAIGMLPAAFFCFLIFSPPHGEINPNNLIWLVVMQFLFYPFFSMYAMPHNALMVELSRTPKERMRLATFISIMNAVASLVASLIPVIALKYVNAFSVPYLKGFQYAVGTLCVFTVICMIQPVLAIRERDYVTTRPSREPIFKSLKTTFENPHFVRFGLADCAYWTGLNMITTGMMYYLTVLLELPATTLSIVMLTLIVGTIAWMPMVNKLAAKRSRKKLITYAFIMFSLVFAMVFFLGKLPFSPKIQAICLAITASLPFSFLGILPTTILADITDHDSLSTGTNREGMFFAARTMMMKLGQIFGIFLFTTLLSFGKEVNHDIGIRLTGVAGFSLCLIAAYVLRGYKESKILNEIRMLKKVQA